MYLLLCFHYISVHSKSAIMAERPDYDVLVKDINLEDITSCERNADILRMLRDGDPLSQLFIMNEEDENGDSPDGFYIDEGDDLGWLGYFIGRSEVLEDLHIYCFFPEGGEDGFYGGMSQNRSIKTLEIQCEMGGEGLAEITATLRLHPQLRNLELSDNNIDRDGCIALGNSLSRWPASNKLETLHIGSNAIDDEGLQALVPGMINCRSLKQLDLGWNRSITANGLRSLFPLLQSEAHSLETLFLYGINSGDDGAIALAEGLTGNKSLNRLWFRPSTAGITAVGWSAFSKLLCDTSTINNTYLSNHTLTKIGSHNNKDTPRSILGYLALNKSIFTDAAMCKSKILQSHPDLDMGPFFEWKMKFLPVAISWLQRAHSSRLGRESNKKYASRKLSALYKFVRAMPDLAVTGYWEGRVIDIEAKKRMLDDEEAVAWERLGGRPIDDASKRKRMRHE